MVGDSSVSVGVAACGVSVRFRGRIQDFSWGGASLRNDVTDKWRKQMLQVHIFCVVREQPGGVDGKERLKRALQSFKILPQTNDRQQMTEEERYVDYGFEHRVSFVKGTLYGVSTLSLRTIFLWSVEQNPQLHWLFFTTPHDWTIKLVSSFQPIECKTWTNRFLINRVSLRWR